MNKEIIEHYGWITVVLILGLVIILMSTPLGNYIYSSVKFDAVEALKESKAQHTVVEEQGDMTTSHKITYNLNGGNWDGNYITSYIEGKTTTMPTNIKHSNEHYEFAGWKDGSGNIIETIPDTKKTDITVTAQWIGKQFTISYNTNGGVFSNKATLNYRYGSGSTITLPTVSKTGYTFNGWYKDSAFTSKVTSINTNSYSENITLYAKWTKN